MPSNNNKSSSFDPLTEQQRIDSAAATAAGYGFAELTWQNLFGRDSSSLLAARVMKLNAVRYHELKREMEYDTCQVSRPLPQIA